MHSVNKSNNSTTQSNDQILEQRKQEIGNILCSSINSNQPIKLDLSKKGLKSFDDIYQIIYDHAKKNPKTKYDFSKLNIKELDISSNQMRHFFNEINFDSRSVYKKNQKAQKLSSITHLNILNNLQLNSIQESILQIQYLIPNIKSLEISLSEEEDVSFIILNMPQLEELNQIKVDRTQSSEKKPDAKQVENEKLKKQPFEMKELEEIKEDDFFQNNFQRDDSHSEFKTSPAQINLDQLNTINLRCQDIQQHLNADIISEIETTLKINQKSIQESFDDGQIDQSEISSGNFVKRKKKSERKNKSQSRVQSNLRQSKHKENQNLNSIESPSKKIKSLNINNVLKETDNQKQENLNDQGEQKEQSPLQKSYYQEENIMSQNMNKKKEFGNQNFENKYVYKKSTSPNKIINAQKPKQTQLIKNKNQIIQEEPLTVEQIKNQISDSNRNSSKETEHHEQLKMNILNLNKDLKGVSDISIQLQSQTLQSPDRQLKQSQMLYIQEQTQDSNTFQSAHHMESEEELQKNEKQQQKENLIVENILQQEDHEDMGRTPNQLSDILEDEREAEIENGLSKGTCNFGNSYSRANNSVFGQTQQIQSVNSSQSQANVVSLHGIGIGLKEFSSSMNSQQNQKENLMHKFKDEKSIQLNNQNVIYKDLLNPILQNKQLINDKENIIVLNQMQQIDQQPQNQKSIIILNQDQEQHEQDIIMQSSRKLQNFIEEKRVKEKIQNQENPTLKPTDLEDLANIFDRIRILFKKKSNSNQPQPKKLILKNSGPTDDLAIQFDQKLTDIMFQLSKVLKDNLVTSSQKNAEIEKSKYLLYIYCNQTCIKFISKYKGNILQKDAKEVEIILSKLNDILNQSFIKMVNFFYTKEDKELKLISQMQIENLSQRCQQYDEMQQKYSQAISELNISQNEIVNLKESFLNQSLRLEEQHYQLRKSEENFNELMYSREEICKLRQQMINFEQVLCENQQIKNEMARLKEYVQDQNKLKKNSQIKEKECQKLKRMISHLHEEIREMKEEGISLFDENQKYLDMIVRYSLGQEKGQNGGMKINLDWLKQRIMRKKKSIYDGHSAFDFKSQMSQSNLSVSPILRSQKFTKNSMMIGLNNGKNKKKLNDVSIRSIQSQNSSGTQIAFKQQLKNETIISEIDEKRGKSLEDKIKCKNIRNMSKSSKFGEKLGQQTEVIFPKDGGYSHIHSYRKSYKKSPLNKEFNLSYQQSKDRQNNKSMVFKQNNIQEKGYDKDMESVKSNFLIKSQNSQKSLDVYQNKQGEEQEEIQKTAAKKLIKVESQLIEKSFTKEILGIQKNRNIISPKKFNENFDQIQTNDQEPISVEDCEPSPSKQFQKPYINFNQLQNDQKNQKLMNSQNEMKLRLGSVKNSNFSNETSENEQFLRQEKEVYLSLLNQNINVNSNKKVPHLNLQENENKHINQNVQQKHQRTFSASNYTVGYFKNGLNDYQQAQHQYNTQTVFTKRSKSASPQHNKEILSINTKNNFIDYNLYQNNTNQAQNQFQLQDIIKRKLHQIDIIQLNKLNQNDYNIKSQELYKIRDFQPLKQQSKEVLSPDLKKQGVKSCKYSLKQIRELITDIYIQKVKHDDKCINMIHQNRETMQQFLCTYLNQKYGLKQIVLEQANAIIQAIGDYQFIDHDVLLFKKVLRNQLDEEFRYVQITIKNTVYQLMKTLLAQKYPSKTSYEIQRIIHDIENGKILIDYWLWQKILNQMYDKTDQFIIHEKLKKMENLFIMEKQYISESKSPHPVLATNLRAESRKRSKELTGRRSVGFNRNSLGSQNFQNPLDPEKQSQKETNKKLSKYTNNPQNHPKYQFQIFMETILLFQLNEHEKFLQKFMQLFLSIDTNQNGVISNQQFILLCKKMNVQYDEKSYPNHYQDEINQLLDIVDPYQCNKITLSDIILLFSKHNLSMLEGNILKSSSKKQVLNIDYSVVGLNKLNDLEKSQSFNLNITKKNIDDSFNQFQSNSEQNFSLQMNDCQKNVSVQSNMQKQILKQKLGELQQIDETTESNMLFTNDNSRQASNQISMIEKSNYLDQYNIQMVNQNSFYNMQKNNEGKDTLGSMETIQKISEDEKRITYEILMLEKKLENKI